MAFNELQFSRFQAYGSPFFLLSFIERALEPCLYLLWARKHAFVVDNRIKHQGYSPSRVDCDNGIEAMEELIAESRNMKTKPAHAFRTVQKAKVGLNKVLILEKSL